MLTYQLKGRALKLKLIAPLLLLAGLAHAESAEQMGYASIGTAFKIISTSAPTVSSVSTVSTFTSNTTPVTYRFMATVDTVLNMSSPSTTTPTAVQTSGVYLPAYVPEYFVIGPRTNIAAITNATGNVTGTLFIGKTGR